jgi:putative ABC transport system permease protein
MSGGPNFFECAIADFRYGVRVARKHPAFALVVIATLALGIGATTAVFSVVYGVVLRALPYPQPDRLVTVGHSRTFTAVGIANYLDWRAQNTVFDEIAITKLTQNFNITGDGEPERVLGGRTSASVFRVLGVRPILGRVFTEEDGQLEDKVVLSEGLWKRRYAGDPAIVGKQIQLNSKPYTVLGVMAADFRYRTREFALWTPLTLDPDEPRGVHDYACIARLRNGVAFEQAQAQMKEIQARMDRTHAEMRDLGMTLIPMRDDVVGNVRTVLYFLMGAVSCLLLIGAVNLANLLVVRAMSQRRELVVRAALGADGGRLVLQSIMQVLPLVLTGGACGVLLAYWMLSLLLPLLPTTMPRLDAIQMDWPVFLFSIGVLCATAILAGIWPALQARRWNITQALRESSRTTAVGAASRLRSALVVGQIAAVVTLLVVSTLLVRSFVVLQGVDPGFRSTGILAIHFALSDKYGTNPRFGQYLKQILDRVSTLPGVISVGMVNRLPLAGQTQTGTLAFDGTTLPQDPGATVSSLNLDWRTVTPGYFRTLGIPLIEGRFFTESDTADHPGVGIVDDRLARTVWPGQSAIGKRFRFGGAQEPWYEVVGVVGHIRHDKLSLDERPQVYWNYLQRVQPRMALAVRTQQDPNQLAASVIAAIHAVDRDQPVYDVRAMNDIVARSLSQEWLTTALLSIFAGVALVLATVGVYGVLSYSVASRVREIGIRMALGSNRGGVVWMVLREAGTLAGLGTAIGLGGSLLLGRVLTSLLYEIKPTDLVSFAAASLILWLVALAAAFIPARRAASVEPLVVLRAE